MFAAMLRIIDACRARKVNACGTFVVKNFRNRSCECELQIVEQRRNGYLSVGVQPRHAIGRGQFVEHNGVVTIAELHDDTAVGRFKRVERDI